MDLKLKFVDSIKRKYKERLLNREKQQWPICKSNRIIDLKLVKRERCESHQSTKLNLKNDIARSPLTYRDIFKQDDRKDMAIMSVIFACKEIQLLNHKLWR